MGEHPADIVARSPMSRMQVAVVVTCICLVALDGFDVLSISFAAPGIAEEWRIDRGALGIVLSMELIGMAAGSIVLGHVADRMGRRPLILLCLLIMAVGMFLVTTANGLTVLSAYRFLTGIGIGGMLATTNAMVAEYSNARRRSLNVTLMAAGYPLGAIVGGAIASRLLATFDWRSVFMLGAATTAAFLPICVWILPESIEYLAQRQPAGALERLNHALSRIGQRSVASLPAQVSTQPGAGHASIRASIFSAALWQTTVLMTAAYFAHIMTFYFILKWIPKLVVDMGFAPPLAGGVLVWANVGGLCGALTLGLLSQRFGVRGLVIAALVAAFFLVTWFGQGQADLAELSWVAACAGFFTNAAVVGIYALLAQRYPTDVRAGGTGFVIGVGRGGAALGPIVAGYLFQVGEGLATVALIMASGSLLAAICLVLLRGSTPVVAAAE